MNRRQAAHLLVSLSLSIGTPAFASGYPDKPIRLVVPYPPGASTDVAARLIAQDVSIQLGQPVVVENRAGASGNIGTEYVARQPADGYTFMLGTDGTHASNAHLFVNKPFDPLHDFTPLALTATNPIVLVVNPSVPAKNVKEFIDGVRSGRISGSYGSSGTGTPHHLAGELLKARSGAPLIHVPYRGGGPAVTDVLGNQIPAVFASVITAMPYLRAGKLRALAITDSQPFAGLPEVPTIASTYAGFDVGSWLAFFGPAKMAPPVAQRLSDAIRAALAKPEIKAKLVANGLVVPADTSPHALSDLLQRDFALKGKIIRDAGIHME